ncbi:hypothetical protein LDO32_00500 [Luteimonas sp. Y-2-2-4F]|nr:hypothetical protein [Luteimonas sp. Y-2-2-4F]MCD9030216.1 hypothetical protein [Luteimonas sp. Y-2-2-4F]
MKQSKIAAAAMAALLSVTGVAFAAVVYVSGQGQGYDPGIALEAARADAIAECTSQGGTPLEEVYSHVTRANLWLASVVMECEVP